MWQSKNSEGRKRQRVKCLWLVERGGGREHLTRQMDNLRNVVKLNAEPFYSWSFAQFANIYVTVGCVVVTSNK